MDARMCVLQVRSEVCEVEVEACVQTHVLPREKYARPNTDTLDPPSGFQREPTSTLLNEHAN